jgi:hypothetical protein
VYVCCLRCDSCVLEQQQGQKHEIRPAYPTLLVSPPHSLQLLVSVFLSRCLPFAHTHHQHQQQVREAEAMVAGGVLDVFLSNEVVDSAKLHRFVALAEQGAAKTVAAAPLLCVCTCVCSCEPEAPRSTSTVACSTPRTHTYTYIHAHHAHTHTHT